jgi:hypothetical protein
MNDTQAGYKNIAIFAGAGILTASLISIFSGNSAEVPDPVEVTVRPEITLPQGSNLQLVAERGHSYNSYDYSAEGDLKGKDKRYIRTVGKIEQIYFNPAGGSLLAVTSAGYVVRVPENVPIAVGESINVQQRHIEDKYSTWICPETSELCTKI